jgi:hypothetical protein
MRVSHLLHEPGGPLARFVLEGVADPATSMTIASPASHASPLVHALTRAESDCSPACDLVLAPARRLETAVWHAVIDRGPDGIRASLALVGHAAPFTLACDVIDALALAVRAGAPIYATHRALGRAAVGAASRATVPNAQIPRHL